METQNAILQQYSTAGSALTAWIIMEALSYFWTHFVCTCKRTPTTERTSKRSTTAPLRLLSRERSHIISLKSHRLHLPLHALLVSLFRIRQRLLLLALTQLHSLEIYQKIMNKIHLYNRLEPTLSVRPLLTDKIRM